MNISFDLDSTIIPNGKEFETENLSLFGKLFGIEKVRKGTFELFSYLQNQGHNVHIYTTSFRKIGKIRRNLKYYGIKVNKIINEKENRKVLKNKKINSSKYPPAFEFDVHIDDSKGVGIESERLNFKVIIVEPTEKNWTEKIKKEIENIFELKTLKILVNELWLQSNNCTEPIENMWFSIFEVSKYTGYKKKEINKYLNLLVRENCLKKISDDPLLFEFTEKGKLIKTDLELKKLIKNVG